MAYRRHLAFKTTLAKATRYQYGIYAAKTSIVNVFALQHIGFNSEYADLCSTMLESR